MTNKITPKVPLIETADGEYDSFYSDDLEEVINQNLKMILLTRRGERTMIPDFGAGVQDFLFEISTGQTISNLRSIITNQIRQFASYITLMDLKIDTGDASLSIKITYSIDATGAVSTFEQTIDNMI